MADPLPWPAVAVEHRISEQETELLIEVVSLRNAGAETAVLVDSQRLLITALRADRDVLVKHLGEALEGLKAEKIAALTEDRDNLAEEVMGLRTERATLIDHLSAALNREVVLEQTLGYTKIQRDELLAKHGPIRAIDPGRQCDRHLGPWGSDPDCFYCKDRPAPASDDPEDHAYEGDGTSGCSRCYCPMNSHPMGAHLVDWNPADPGCTCAVGGMGRRSSCPVHGIKP